MPFYFIILDGLVNKFLVLMLICLIFSLLYIKTSKHININFVCFVVFYNLRYHRTRQNSICLKFSNQTELCPALSCGKIVTQ